MSSGVLGRLLESLWQLPPAVSGGLAGLVTGPLGVYLLNWWRTRPRLRVRIAKELLHEPEPHVDIEVDNLGDDTSLEPDQDDELYATGTATTLLPTADRAQRARGAQT